ncbi:hypothetical protein [Mangrovibrevibacter kandeliae]|uniref:hypothetical protein n=1 Tax=Mangrovibrevibacter kandeliae TaxID=2968473 RepID=UPI002117EEFC|nr:hypothetical protein [Aurantimonas sp. CSK15Z-1]MCQ8781296.1 hypothetical protein [Aurantimonas sp. CSK15Z-1]
MPAQPAIDFVRDTTAVLPFPAGKMRRQDEADDLDERARRDLDRLRWLAMKSRLVPKPDLERACYLLAGEPAASLDRYAAAFFRGLDLKSHQRMALYRPGSRTASEDEIWLLRLVGAWRSDDAAGAAALVAFRIPPESRRWLRFLSRGLQQALDAALT